MIDKIRASVEELQSLRKKMEDPAIYGDRKELTKVARRVKQLEPLEAKYKEYVRLEQAIAEEKAFASDPELKAVAEDDARKAREKMPVLLEEMRRLLIPKNPDDEKSV